MKKTKFIQLVLLLILIGIIFSCKTNFGNRTYVLDRGLKFDIVNGVEKPHPQTTTKKSIVIVNDSILNYTVLLGDFGTSTTLKYQLKNGLLTVDTIDIYNRKPVKDKTNDIFGYEFQYFKDSLINKKTGEKYYLAK